MNKWKISFFASFAMFIITAIIAVYLVIDSGTAYTYLEVSLQDQIEANRVLGNLIVIGGASYSQQDILHLLRQEYPEAFIVQEGNQIIMGPNRFTFESGKLVGVQ